MITDDEWKVVEARAKELPEKFYIGLLGKVLTKKDLLDSIKRKDKFGEAYAKMQMRFISWSMEQALK